MAKIADFRSDTDQRYHSNRCQPSAAKELHVAIEKADHCRNSIIERPQRTCRQAATFVRFYC